MGSCRGSTHCCRDASIVLSWLSFASFCVYAISFACPFWLTKTFPGRDQNGFVTEIDSQIGLVWSCNKITTQVLIQSGRTSVYVTEKCDTLTSGDLDKVNDWQYASAGMGIAALLAVFIGTILSCRIACRRQRNVKCRYGVVFFYLLATVLVGATVVLFYDNRDIQIAPPLPNTIEYDMDWGYFLSGGSACLFLFVAILNGAVRYCLPEKMNQAEEIEANGKPDIPLEDCKESVQM